MSVSVPEIDIGPLVRPDTSYIEQNSVLQQIDEAMRNIGFMSITNHGVSKELIERMMRTSKQFFYLSEDSKMSVAPRHLNPSNTNTYRGYIPSSVFGKECFDIGEPFRKFREDPSCFSTEMNKFPVDMTAGQIEIIDEYFTALHSLATTLVKSVFKIFGANLSQAELMTKRPDAEATVRLNFYPQQQPGYKESEISAEDGTKLCCETHADSGAFTVLYQDTVGGLQVQSPDSKHWINVPCNADAFVVNTGVGMQRMTNDRYKATYHRVKLSTKERQSIPFFFLGPPQSNLDPGILCPNEVPHYPVMTWKHFNVEWCKQFKEYRERFSTNEASTD